MRGALRREGLYVYLELIHVVVQWKITQHCKAIILQLKKNFNGFKKERKNNQKTICSKIKKKKKTSFGFKMSSDGNSQVEFLKTFLAMVTTL